MKKKSLFVTIALLIIFMAVITTSANQRFFRGELIIEGMNVTDGDIESVGRLFSNNITSDNVITAVEFVDLTRGYNGNRTTAKIEILAINITVNGDIDHSTLPEFTKMTVLIRNGSGDKTQVDGRSLGAMISMLVETVKQNEDENIALRAELCNVSRNAYSWC